MSHLRSSRRLRDVAQFEVQLFLDLQFVDEATASELETFDVANVNVIHFCNAVQAQVQYTYGTAPAVFFPALPILRLTRSYLLVVRFLAPSSKGQQRPTMQQSLVAEVWIAFKD